MCVFGHAYAAIQKAAFSGTKDSRMQKLGGIPLPSFPSNYWLPGCGLMLSLYVDDILVSGPSKRHKPFWEAMRMDLEINPPADVSRVLGRGHEISREGNVITFSFEMTD